MTIEELTDSIKTEKESGNFTLQAIFDRHIEAIEDCKKSGISYKRIKEVLDLDIADSHFNNLIYRARQKQGVKTESIKPEIPASKPAEINTVQVEEEKETDSSPTKLNQSKNEWFNETGKDLSEELIERFEKNGIDTEKFNTLDLNTSIQMHKYLNELELSSKYK